jgi:hypothetical protein
MTILLNLHIPSNTYSGRIESILLSLYNESAKIMSRELREEKLKIINYALEFVRVHYESSSEPHRYQINNEGVVTVEDAPVSNIRIFF